MFPMIYFCAYSEIVITEDDRNTHSQSTRICRLYAKEMGATCCEKDASVQGRVR